MADLEKNLIKRHQHKVDEQDKRIGEVSMSRLAMIMVDYQLTVEECEAIGDMLEDEFGDLYEVAQRLGIRLNRLKNLIRCNPALMMRWKDAHSTIKNLTDHHIIQKIKEGDTKVLLKVFDNMYSGNKKGGFGAKEVGTMDNDDEIAKELKPEQRPTNVNIIFKGQSTPVQDFKFVEGEVLGEEISPNENDGE